MFEAMFSENELTRRSRSRLWTNRLWILSGALGTATLVSMVLVVHDTERQRAAAESLRARLGVKCASLEQPVRQLSGGNQQKVVLGRWLDRDFDVLLCDEPTRGVDVAARSEIHELLRELARFGKAVLVVSSEIEELLTLCDRIVVLSAGTVAATFERGRFDRDAILEAALRGHAGRSGVA